MKRKPRPRPPLCASDDKALPDSPFLELLFAAMCRNLQVLPKEGFVSQVDRWMTLWRLTAALQPNNEQEWLQAAAVTTKRAAAAYHLVMRSLPRLTREQRAHHDEGMLLATKAAATALKHYRLLQRSNPAGGGA